MAGLERFISQRIPLAVIVRGFWKLSLILLPVSLFLFIFIGIMAGGSPTSSGVISSFLSVFSFLFLAPAGLVIFHIILSKLFDSILQITPFFKAEVSVVGILFSIISIIFIANGLIDDFYQFKKGNMTPSIIALVLDSAGMLSIIVIGKKITLKDKNNYRKNTD